MLCRVARYACRPAGIEALFLIQFTHSMIAASRASSGVQYRQREAMAQADGIVTLTAGELSAELWPEVGGSLGALYRTAGGSRVDWPRPAAPASVAEAGPLAMGSFPLVPYSGRIRDGRFSFGGRNVALPLNFLPERHSIHGHGWKMPWRVSEASPARAVLDYRHLADAWPFP